MRLWKTSSPPMEIRRNFTMYANVGRATTD